jgi:hypothetical protein
MKRRKEITTDDELMQRAFEMLDPFVRLGWTVARVVGVFDATGVFFDNGAAVAFDKSEYRIVGYREEGMPATLASMRRVNKSDGSGAWRLINEDGHTVLTVGDVFANRGGTDFTLCICSQTERKPVVAFKIYRDALNRKELSFNVI